MNLDCIAELCKVLREAGAWRESLFMAPRDDPHFQVTPPTEWVVTGPCPGWACRLVVSHPTHGICLRTTVITPDGIVENVTLTDIRSTRVPVGANIEVQHYVIASLPDLGEGQVRRVLWEAVSPVADENVHVTIRQAKPASENCRLQAHAACLRSFGMLAAADMSGLFENSAVGEYRLEGACGMGLPAYLPPHVTNISRLFYNSNPVPNQPADTWDVAMLSKVDEWATCPRNIPKTLTGDVSSHHPEVLLIMLSHAIRTKDYDNVRDILNNWQGARMTQSACDWFKAHDTEFKAQKLDLAIQALPLRTQYLSVVCANIRTSFFRKPDRQLKVGEVKQAVTSTSTRSKRK